jgi:formate dehydrogenase subunit beta
MEAEVSQEVLTQETRQIVRKLLRDDLVIGVVGLRLAHNRVGPHLFTLADDLAGLKLEPRYPLADICQAILSNATKGKVGVIVRGCDERALIEMSKLGRVAMERLELIGLACSESQARLCVCAHPYPRNIHVGQKVDGVAPMDDERVKSLIEKDLEERWAFWKQEFARCIKCYGCRNICPVCICDECVLEEACWVERGQIPPELSFHLIRAYHIADKCVGCGACEATCPMEIPLTTFHTLVQEQIKTLFNYEPGMDIEQMSPLTTTLEEMPLRGL